MYKTLHKKQGSVTVQLRFARSSVTFCAKRDISREKSVSVETLLVIQQEILQLIYTNLYQNGIQAAELFGDEVSRKIQRQSVRSVFDMIKWVNYAISRTLEYEDEINRSLSLADKIESYVKEHYKEIGRAHV